MPVFDILCLANSKKHGGRCVAGLRTDGEGWIRPVSFAREGTLYERHYTLDDGSEARVLDLLRIRFAIPRPEPHHPENRLITHARWQLLSRPAPQEVLGLLESHLTPGPELLGSLTDRVPFAAFEAKSAAGSLALVEPDDLRWVIKTSRAGERRTRVAFTLRGMRYNLALTDPDWERRLSPLAIGEHPRRAGGIEDSARLFLTVSLSEPFQSDDRAEKFCYKLVAAVIALPQSAPPTGSLRTQQDSAPHGTVQAAPVRSLSPFEKMRQQVPRVYALDGGRGRKSRATGPGWGERRTDRAADGTACRGDSETHRKARSDVFIAAGEGEGK